MAVRRLEEEELEEVELEEVELEEVGLEEGELEEELELLPPRQSACPSVRRGRQ